MKDRILIVDDERAMREVLVSELVDHGFDVSAAASGDEALELLAREEFDVVVTDVKMRGLGGLDLCGRIVDNRPELPVVVITAFGSLETAISAIRAGAYDFITKPFDVEALAVALRRAVENRRLRQEVKRLQARVARIEGESELLGESDAMRRLCSMIDRVTESDASVLITGESGTGKELVARELHQRGRRAGGPFVALNCAAVPEPLLESELFGHVRGAFTDAKEGRAGLLVEATGGTLFLDEIGDMPLAMQAKLLRALQERKVRPVGGSKEIAFDVRVVAATNRDLESAIEEQHFREDLYWRINVIHLQIPPLRARGGDVLLLAQRFLQRAAAAAKKPVTGISAEAAKRLIEYSWPGNVRELQNCIERAVALALFAEITVDDLPDRIQHYSRRDVIVAGTDPSELVTLEEVEKRYFARVLEAVRGNKVQAARILGIDRGTLYRRLQRYGMLEDERDPNA